MNNKVLYIGTGGLAMQCSEIIKRHEIEFKPYFNSYFFDEINFEFPSFVENVIKSKVELDLMISLHKSFFKCYNILIGKPSTKKYFHNLIERVHGLIAKPLSLIAHNAEIQKNSNQGDGCIILGNSLLESYSTIGNFVLVNYGAKIHHGVNVGNYCEICPGATLLGGVSVGDETTVGTNAIILPNIKIGKNSYIGAGSVVTKDVPNYSVVMGVPAKLKD